MRFLYPEFLYALTALSVPLVVHLFNFRKYRRIYFTNVRFLREIRQDTRSQSRLKHLLVLISRLLAISFLVLAFARPYIPGSGSGNWNTDKAVSIYIDNSFSMEGTGGAGSLLEECKRKAREIATSCRPSDKLQLLTNDFEGRHQRFVSREEFYDLVEHVTLSASVRSLQEVLSRQEDMLNHSGAPGKYAYILSDFQASILGQGELQRDTSIQVFLLPAVAARPGNIVIDSCWFSSPVLSPRAPVKLVARIKNMSPSPVENISVKVYLDGVQKALGSITVTPGSSADLSMPFTIPDAGLHSGFVSITDNPVTFDDTYFISFEIARDINILCINGEKENPYIESVYKSDSCFLFNRISAEKIDYSSLKSVRLLILNGLRSISTGMSAELKKFLDRGGSVAVFPSADAELNSYNSMFSQYGMAGLMPMQQSADQVETINTRDEFFSGVFEQVSGNTDLPKVRNHFPLLRNSKSLGIPLLTLHGGESFMTLFPSGKSGRLYLFSSPPDSSSGNFSLHALFVPVMYRMALLSQAEDIHSYSVGAGNSIEIRSAEPAAAGDLHLVAKGGGFDVIPELRENPEGIAVFLHGQVSKAGTYFLEGKGDTSVLSFNYDRRESDLRCVDASGLKALAEKFPGINVVEISGDGDMAVLSDASAGKQLWKLCIVLTLVFLGIEILLLRFPPKKNISKSPEGRVHS